MESIDSILESAKECLNCKVPMCRKGCPVYTSIPEFISKIKEEKFKDAYKILKENNVFSEICSLVCPTEEQCMGHCVKRIKGKAVDISKLELFINSWAREKSIKYNVKTKKSNNTKVAVIGAGPAGIACAVELKKKGYEVTIFEKNKKIGGILEYEIPDFRLNKKQVAMVKKEIEELGIEIKYKFKLGENLSLEKLNKKGYKSVFLGIGAGLYKSYKLLEEPNSSIIVAKELFQEYYKKNKERVLGKTIIIGGGNVAMDAARVAKRQGASSVTVVYRRNKEQMPAIDSEVKMAEEEGVEFIFNTKVISANTNKMNRITSVNCIKTKVEEGLIKDIPKSDYKIPVDTIVFAMGIGLNEELTNNLGINVENGLVVVDKNGMTNIPGVFAGGDLVEKNQTVCKAISTGKKAAEGIDRYLVN